MLGGGGGGDKDRTRKYAIELNRKRQGRQSFENGNTVIGKSRREYMTRKEQTEGLDEKVPVIMYSELLQIGTLCWLCRPEVQGWIQVARTAPTVHDGISLGVNYPLSTIDLYPHGRHTYFLSHHALPQGRGEM